MSKLAHSYEPTMDKLEMKRAREAGVLNEMCPRCLNLPGIVTIEDEWDECPECHGNSRSCR